MSRHLLQGIGSRLSSYNHGSVGMRESEKESANNISPQGQKQQEKSYNTIQVQKRPKFRKQTHNAHYNNRNAQRKNIFARGRFVSSAELEDASSSSSYGTECSDLTGGKRQQETEQLVGISNAQVGKVENTSERAYDTEQANNDSSHYSGISTDTASTGKVADSIIRRSGNAQEDYDYKIFNTSRPLRLSKVRALEQAEVTSKLYFRQKQDDLYEETAALHDVSISQHQKKVPKVAYIKTRRKLAHSNKEIAVSTGRLWKRKRGSWFSGGKERRSLPRNSKELGRTETDRQVEEEQADAEDNEKQISEEKANAEILVQLPELSKAETRRMMQQDCMDVDLDNCYLNGDIEERDWPFPQTEAQKRMNAMKRALKPLNEQEMVEQRLRRSRLPKIFQNTGVFLSRLNLRELEYWEMMNEQFDDEMSSLVPGRMGNVKKSVTNNNQENNTESRGIPVTEENKQQLDFINVPFDAIYGRNIDHDTALAVTNDLRRRIKDDIQFDDEMLDLKLQDD